MNRRPRRVAGSSIPHAGCRNLCANSSRKLQRKIGRCVCSNGVSMVMISGIEIPAFDQNLCINGPIHAAQIRMKMA